MFIIVITKTFIDNLWPRRYCENIWVIQNYEGISLKYQRRIFFLDLFFYIYQVLYRVYHEIFLLLLLHTKLSSLTIFIDFRLPHRVLFHIHITLCRFFLLLFLLFLCLPLKRNSFVIRYYSVTFTQISLATSDRVN